jgi:2-polyprenyl-3-methyl-5-hydroxy-6-metoxy-1,4-benzoquinol methylase
MSRPACRLCSSTQLGFHFGVGASQLDRCGACGFVQVRERPSAEQLRVLYSAGYFRRGKYDEEFAQQKESERRLGLLARASVPAGGRVLDAGCATGDFVAAAGQRYEMWGLDVSSYATELARARNPSASSRIFTGFIEEQRFEPAFFDAIVMWDVIEHIWDPRAVLRSLVKHLRPGGTLILSTPDIGAWTARLMRRRWAFMTPPEHLGFFSPRSLRFLLQQDLGLEITFSRASGKWTNLGFAMYKLGRVFPGLVPARVLGPLQQSAWGAAALYVPTADIRYVAARRPEV